MRGGNVKYNNHDVSSLFREKGRLVCVAIREVTVVTVS